MPDKPGKPPLRPVRDGERKAQSGSFDDLPEKLGQFVVARVKRRMRQGRQQVTEIVARVQSVLDKPARSREDLHQLLDACLDLSAIGGGASDCSENAARQLGVVLARGAFGWTEPQERPVLALDWASLRADPELWRHELWYRLRRAPHVLPSTLVDEFLEALLDLDRGDGKPVRLLAPVPKEGRGKNPREGREIEEMLWRWIYWEAAGDRSIETSKARVADVVGRSTKAVEKWREDWIRRAGKDEVDDDLARCRELGASGVPPLWGRLSLEEIADLWREARSPEEEGG